jgi:hypothetical protein
MSNTTKNIILAVVALIIGIVFGAMFAPKNSNLGGLVRLTQDQFAAGLKAGTTGQFVISSAGAVTSSGALSAGAISGTTGTFTGIATLATTSVRSLCVFNGTEFTKISFAAGSTTPAYATSTTCL